MPDRARPRDTPRASDPDWESYLEAVIEIHSDRGVRIDLARPVSAEDAGLLEEAGLSEGFAIVTACDPGGRDLPPDENRRRCGVLDAEILAMGVRAVRADGISTDGRHRERGWAIVVDLASALALASRHGQSAVYWYEHGAFELVPALEQVGARVRLPIRRRAHRGSRDGERGSGFPAVATAMVALLLGCGEPPPPLVVVPASKPPVVFEDVGVLDVDAGVVVPRQDVLVEGGRIERVGAHGSIAIPGNARRVEGRGSTLMPGLVDAHGHVANGSAPPWVPRLPDPDRNLQAYLYAGVTTVLDPADLEPDAFERRDAVAAGVLAGPRIFAAGPMLTAEGGHPLPVLDELAPWWIRWYLRAHATRPLASVDDAKRAVAGLDSARADFVKLAIDAIPSSAPTLAPALAEAVVRSAHEAGLRVVAHVGSFEDARLAGAAGVDAFVHMVYKEALDPASAKALAAFGKPIVATIGVFDSYAALGRGPRVPTSLEVETVEPELLEAFDRVPEGAVSKPFLEYFDLLHASREARRANLRALRMAGATILAGSDCQSGVFPGAGLHRELATLVEAGMTPAEALRAATLDAARFLERREDPSFGVVAAGKRADLVLVAGNPTFDIHASADIRAVMQAGALLERRPIAGATSAPDDEAGAVEGVPVTR